MKRIDIRLGDSKQPNKVSNGTKTAHKWEKKTEVVSAGVWRRVNMVANTEANSKKTNNNSFQYSEIHDPRRHSSPYVPTATAHRSSVGPDKGGSRLERSLAGRVDHDQESGLGLAWRPTGPDVRPTNSTPAPVYVGGGGVSPAAKLRYMDGNV